MRDERRPSSYRPWCRNCQQGVPGREARPCRATEENLEPVAQRWEQRDRNGASPATHDEQGDLCWYLSQRRPGRRGSKDIIPQTEKQTLTGDSRQAERPGSRQVLASLCTTPRTRRALWDQSSERPGRIAELVRHTRPVLSPNDMGTTRRSPPRSSKRSLAGHRTSRASTLMYSRSSGIGGW